MQKVQKLSLVELLMDPLIPDGAKWPANHPLSDLGFQIREERKNETVKSGFSLLCTLLAHVQLVEHDPQVLFCKAAFHLVSPQPELVHGVIPPQVQDLQFPLLNSIRFLSAHFSSLLRSLWTLAQSFGVSATRPSFATSANLLRVNSAPSSRPLMKMLNSAGPSINPRGTPLLEPALGPSFTQLAAALGHQHYESAAPLSLVSSAKLLRVHSIPLPMPLMKTLNSIGPSTDP
ncbi:hypothetical protein QYF61_011409 [Mycteria americana]|uniref:Uncharacterized protein n=1 Tax=Mycteria americana TaxID=33587 RepID=A0AAN7Q1H7_MYCAM|nr:hypothetical protein QYF61_011409 [Mycteria americana]